MAPVKPSAKTPSEPRSRSARRVARAPKTPEQLRADLLRAAGTLPGAGEPSGESAGDGPELVERPRSSMSTASGGHTYDASILDWFRPGGVITEGLTIPSDNEPALTSDQAATRRSLAYEEINVSFAQFEQAVRDANDVAESPEVDRDLVQDVRGRLEESVNRVLYWAATFLGMPDEKRSSRTCREVILLMERCKDGRKTWTETLDQVVQEASARPEESDSESEEEPPEVQNVMETPRTSHSRR